MLSAQTFFYSAIGGILPSFIWLLFWLREDKLHPEPKKMILFSFLMGMLSVFFVLYIESYIKTVFSGVIMIVLWATTEEIFKFGAAYISALRTKNFDEPVDAMVYLITAALGFSALENTLFLLTPIHSSDIFDSVNTANLRFIGASLLHILTSGTIGAFIAFAFYKTKKIKRIYLAIGVILGITLHAFFNLFIIKDDGVFTFFVFCAVWTAIVILFLVFEKVKRIRN